MKIHYNKDFDSYMTTDSHKTDNIELDGVQLIPITELEKIREEIGVYYADCSVSISENDEQCRNCNEVVFGSIIRMIDNHISELKGE